MADISKITLPNGSSYDFKDSAARSGLAGKAAASHTHTTADQINPASISSGYTIRPIYLNTHPENGGAIVPFINNDIAFLLKRGGSAKIYYDGVERSVDISAVFDGSGSYWAINPKGITTIVIELSLHRRFGWTNTIYIDFGRVYWRAKNIDVSVMNTDNGETSWSSKGAVTNYDVGAYKVTFMHNGETGFNKIKFTFSGWASNDSFRIACLGVLNFDSRGLRETFLPKDGGTLYGGIAPYANNAYDLGSSSFKWRNIYGNLVGNADTVDGKHASDFASASHTHTKSQITDFPTIPTYGIATSSSLGLVKSGTDITVDSSGNVSVNDDSHNHVISNVDGLQSALDGKADISHTHDEYASKDLYSDTTINFGRKAGTYVGLNSTAEGQNTTASGTRSHAEGYGTTATESNSHAEGFCTLASDTCAHAEGQNTTASGENSHAEGYNTTASMNNAHAEGASTTASAVSSHSEGVCTTASNYASHASGKYNAVMTAGGSSSNTTGTAFVIGNGTSDSAKSNAFSVQYDGTVKAKSTITASTTADYAEFFEWLDENPDSEDRVGYFVTMDGDKIRIANADDDYILGVVSGEPFVLGNGDCDTWNGMFLRDEFRRTIYEPAPKMEEILDDDGKPTGEYVEVEGEYEGTRPKLNPDYDHTKKYTSRFDRKEWAPIGMLGVLAVRHDGTAKVNGYVTVADGGIATACDKNAENSYRVIKANTESVVEIIFR